MLLTRLELPANTTSYLPSLTILNSFLVFMCFLFPALPLLEDAASIHYEAAHFSSFSLFLQMSETVCLFTPYFSQTLLTVAPFSMFSMSSCFFATHKFTRLRFTDLLILLLILDKTQNFLAKSNEGYS